MQEESALAIDMISGRYEAMAMQLCEFSAFIDFKTSWTRERTKCLMQSSVVVCEHGEPVG